MQLISFNTQSEGRHFSPAHPQNCTPTPFSGITAHSPFHLEMAGTFWRDKPQTIEQSKEYRSRNKPLYDYVRKCCATFSGWNNNNLTNLVDTQSKQ